MGHLTPVLIRNDDLDGIAKDPEIIEKLISACLSREEKSIGTNYWIPRKWYQFWRPKRVKTVAGSCNAIESMGSRHADEPRLLVVSGNTMIELSSFDDLDKHSEAYRKFALRCAEFALREAQEVLLAHKKSK